MVSPRISVIIPFYNAQETLAACLDSLKSQTLREIEIILVDDGSTDDGLAVARFFADSYDGSCTVLTKENGGPSSARNQGLSAATGDFVAFVDSDDTIEPTMYEKLLFSADEYGADIVSCGRAIIDSETGEVVRTKTPGYDVLRGTVAENPDMVKRVGPLMCDKMFRRSIIEEHGIRFAEDIWYAEDFLFGTQVKLHASCVSAVRENLYCYVQSGESITGGLAHVMDIPEVCRRVVELHREAGVLDCAREQLLFVLVGYYLRKCKTMPKDGRFDQFKAEFVELFNRDFSSAWKLMVVRRVAKGYRMREMPRMLLRALG